MRTPETGLGTKRSGEDWAEVRVPHRSASSVAVAVAVTLRPFMLLMPGRQLSSKRKGKIRSDRRRLGTWCCTVLSLCTL